MEEASSIAKAIETAWNRAGQPSEFTIKILELPQTSFFGLKTSKSAKIAFFFNEATVKARDAGARQESSDRYSQQRHGQRPVTLRQTGSKPESDYAKATTDRHDQQRRPYQSQQRTERSPQEHPDKTSADRADRRETRESRPHDQQRQDRSQSDRRDGRSQEQRPERGQRRFEGSQDRRQRHSDYAKTSSDRSDYAKTSDYAGERSEHGHMQERESWTPEMSQTAQEWIKETLVLMGKPDISVSTHVSHNYLKVNLSASVLEDARQEETQLKSWGMLAMEAVREKVGKPLRSLRIVLESPKK